MPWLWQGVAGEMGQWKACGVAGRCQPLPRTYLFPGALVKLNSRNEPSNVYASRLDSHWDFDGTSALLCDSDLTYQPFLMGSLSAEMQ